MVRRAAASAGRNVRAADMVEVIRLSVCDDGAQQERKRGDVVVDVDLRALVDGLWEKTELLPQVRNAKALGVNWG